MRKGTNWNCKATKMIIKNPVRENKVSELKLRLSTKNTKESATVKGNSLDQPSRNV